MVSTKLQALQRIPKTIAELSAMTLDLDNTQHAILAEFDKLERKFRKEKVLFNCWKSAEFQFHQLFKISPFI